MTRIAVVGLPYFGVRVASSLAAAGFDARFVPSPRAGLRNPGAAAHLARARLVYAIGSSIARGSPLDLLARTGKRVLMHWVGTDVQAARQAARLGRVSGRLRGAAHWADAPWLIDELAPLGVEADEHPLPMPIAFNEPLPAPAEHCVLVYLPEGSGPNYDVEAMTRVIDTLPGVPFVAVGGGRLERPNVEVLGYVTDMRTVYRRVSCYLRLVHHDGLSHMVVEALSAGRRVIWSYSLPGVTMVGSPEEAAAAIARQVTEPPAWNIAGIEAAVRYRGESAVAEAATALEALTA